MLEKPMSNSKVSILLMTYNHERFIKRAIESALSQTYQNIEIIISNNGSSDNTSTVIKSFLPNSKIKFLDYADNCNTNDRANEAIDMASGDYISWLYGDDYYFNSKIEDQLKIFKKLDSTYGVVYSPGYTENFFSKKLTPCRGQNSSGNVLHSFFSGWLKNGSVIPISPLVKKVVYDKYRYDNSIFAEGEVLYIHIACKFKFHFLDKPLVVMTEHDTNLGKAFKDNMESHEHSIFRLIRENHLSEESMKHAIAHLCELKIGSSWHAFRVGKEIKWAKKNLYEAFKMSKLCSSKNKYFFPSLMMLHIPRKMQSFINTIVLAIKRSALS
jgi:glycosyltransferase involved in cell wall biosynthesis